MQEQILTFLIPALALIFAAGLVALWSLDRSKTYILAFAAWLLTRASATAIQVWTLSDFPEARVLLYHLVISAGEIALVWAIARRDGRATPVGILAVMSILNGLIAAYAIGLGSNAVLILSQNYNLALLMALGAFGLWMRGVRKPADKVLLVALASMAAYAMFRPPLTVLAMAEMGVADYRSSAFLTLNLVLSELIALLIAISLVACILSDRLQLEREEAAIDPLSGLPSRSAFEGKAAQMLARSVAEDRALSLLVADIDHFKTINDTYGHALGDRVIAGFGEMIAGKIRATDFAGRVGGEEFCVLVWNCKAGEAARLADRIRVAAEAGTRRGDDESLPAYTASLGVAQARRGESYASLFRRADAALYAAKNAGRNRVAIADGDPGFDPDGFAYRPLENDHPPSEGAKIVPLVRRQAR